MFWESDSPVHNDRFSGPCPVCNDTGRMGGYPGIVCDCQTVSDSDPLEVCETCGGKPPRGDCSDCDWGWKIQPD